MKCETFNIFLTFLLGVSVVFGVVFALRTVFHTRELRSLQSQMLACQVNVNRLNMTLNAAAQYAKTHPDIEHIIQPFEPKPAAR
ncbi:MAG TPA: hypothetical protein VN836_10045 [Verrucomicrobiae bacterium]|nr:hypothetical protein [Verrucomicrobiae bacterium]